MKKLRWMLAALALAAGLTAVVPFTPSQARPAKPAAQTDQTASTGQAKPAKTDLAPRPAAAPLSDTVMTGLGWLTEHQMDSGGWGQGEESQQMGGGAQMAYQANVADTCMATLALLRSGSTPSKGKHADNIRRGVEFVVGQIEKADEESLYVTEVRGTRVQSKIGTYVDTFLASMLLSEVKGKMGSDNARVEKALNKVIAKIENHQTDSGTWNNQGWAPVLSQSLAAKGLNRARQAGATVNDATLGKTAGYAQNSVSEDGAVSGEGSAGVDLYATSSTVASMQETANTNAVEKKRYEEKLKNAKNEDERREAEQQLGRIRDQEVANERSREMVLRKIQDPQFIAGFGSNGGEEFLSYMNISEALVVEGGKDWQNWNQAMHKNLSRVQNPDGSWSGHHCITGKTFCTSAALLVLTADRAPLPTKKS